MRRCSRAHAAHRHGRLVDSVPAESLSVPLLLACMLEQVVATVERPSSAARAPTAEPESSDTQLNRVLDAALAAVTGEEILKKPRGSLGPRTNSGASVALPSWIVAQPLQSSSSMCSPWATSLRSTRGSCSRSATSTRRRLRMPCSTTAGRRGSRHTPHGSPCPRPRLCRRSRRSTSSATRRRDRWTSR